jgi:hypothetical protein
MASPVRGCLGAPHAFAYGQGNLRLFRVTMSSSPSSLRQAFRHLVLGLVLSVVLAYPLLSFAQKYTIPWTGMNDFSSYHDMVLSPLRFDAVRAPFAMRQLTAVVARGVLELGIGSDRSIWFQQHATMWQRSYSVDVFLALLVANFAGAVLAGAVVYAAAARHDRQPPSLPVSSWGLGAVALLFLSGGTLFYVIAPLTEGWTWALAAIMGVLWKRRDGWAWAVVPLLFVCIFQREMLPLAFLIMAAAELAGGGPDGRRRRFLVALMVASTASLAAYAALRGAILPVRATDVHQIEPLGWAGGLMRELPALFTPVMLRAALLKLNLVLVWLSFVAWAARRRLLGGAVGWDIAGLAGAALAFFLIALANGAGRAVDRYVIMLAPLFVLSLVELARHAAASARRA